MAQLPNTAKAFLNKVSQTTHEAYGRLDIKQAANDMQTLASQGFEATKAGVANIDLKQSAATAKDWAIEHPYQASFHVATGVVLLAPGVVTMPILGAVGFGATGVTAGSSAAAIQAGVGNVVAKGGFACLQSAAMGGYGLGVVNGVAQGVAVVAQAVGVGAGIRRGKRGQEGGVDGQEGVGAGEAEAGGMEDDGLDPVVEDGIVDMEDEAVVKDVKSRM